MNLVKEMMEKKISFYELGFLDGLTEENKVLVNEKMEELADYLSKNDIQDSRCVTSFPAVRRIWGYGGKYVEKDYSVKELLRRLEEYPNVLSNKFHNDIDIEAETVAFVSETFRTKDAPGSAKGTPKWKELESLVKKENKNIAPK